MHIPAPLPVRVLTHNIRYAKSPPLFPGESPWEERCPGLVAELKFAAAHHAAPLIFLQEVLHPQLQDIVAGLNASPGRSQWAHLGVGRDDGATQGEYSLILYQPAVWDVLDVKTRWLSQHPYRPGSMYPGAGSPRLVTIAHLRHSASSRELLALSTHLDDQSSDARLFAARKLLGYAAEFSVVKPKASGAVAYRVPVILGGDLNSETHEEAYRMITNGESGKDDRQAASKPDTAPPLVDTWLAAPVDGRGAYRYGPEDTFTGFEGKKKDLKRIDFVFAHPASSGNKTIGVSESGEGIEQRGSWEIEGAAVLPNVFDDNVYVSDHRAVLADLLLRRDA